ncbi:MAG: trypsin-like peptidase domain-containing protein [Candidatus Izemoplasmatales bacterium]|jgi:S1-C subfamily serine protease
MRKIATILGLMIILGAFIGCRMITTDDTQRRILLQESLTTTDLPTTTPVETTHLTSGNMVEVWNYEDLYEQVYQRIYDEIYQNLYEELQLSDIASSEVTDLIYQRVQAHIQGLLSDGDISIYMDVLQNAIYEVATLTDASVVGVTSYLGTVGKSLGSGVIYRYHEETDTYFLITNHHVIESGDNFTVVFSDESSVEAMLLGSDAEVDIALLSFSGADLDREITVSILGDSDAAQVGAFVIAGGNPKGYNFYGSITIGILSGKERKIDQSRVRYMQHDASINSGNSGGPIYNLLGEVIGINVSKYASTDIEGMGFAIPINLVKTIIATIEADLP